MSDEGLPPVLQAGDNNDWGECIICSREFNTGEFGVELRRGYTAQGFSSRGSYVSVPMSGSFPITVQETASYAHIDCMVNYLKAEAECPGSWRALKVLAGEAY